MSIMSEAKARIEGWSEKESERTRANRLFADLKATDWRRNLDAAAKNVEVMIDAAQTLEELRAAVDAREAARADGQAYNELYSWLETRSKTAPAGTDAPSEAQVEPALAWLNEQMLELMTFVRKLDKQLGHVTSIEQAIRDDNLIRQWRDIEDAADRYQQILSAQESICRMTMTLDGPALTVMLDEVGRLRNSFDTHRQWIFKRTPTRAATRGVYDSAFLNWLESPAPAVFDWEAKAGQFSAWPFETQGPLDTRQPRAADRIRVLRWLAKNNAAWVPTFAQIRAAAADIAAMLAPLYSIAETRFALEAFGRYYTARGVKPAKHFDGRAALAALPKPRGMYDNRDADGIVRADPRIVAAYE